MERHLDSTCTKLGAAEVKHCKILYKIIEILGRTHLSVLHFGMVYAI